MYDLIIIGVVAVSLIVLIVTMVKRYKRCPSDKLLVVYGKTGKNTEGSTSTAKVSHGGGAFVWPVIQDYEFLDLKPISIIINLENALSKQNIRIDVPSTFTVAISADPLVRQNAAERLLGLDVHSIENLAKDIIFGQMRLVIATMDIEEINANRDSFLTNIQTNLEDELKKIGLKLINVNVTDISDESGYIEALGKEAAAKAINDAKVSVAEKTREGQIGVAEAEKEQTIKVSAANAKARIGEAVAEKDQTIQVSAANADAKIGEANADQKKRVQEAAANATAIEGENTSSIAVADSTAQRDVAVAEANKVTTTARKVKAAEALKASYKAEEDAETQRATKEKATQYADVVVPAEIAKDKLVVEADAKAEAVRIIAKGDADAKFMDMEAEAKGINEILVKQADGYAKLVAAAGSPENAVQLMITDKLPELLAIQVEAIKNVKIDKITVWDNGSNGGGDGETSTAGFVKGLFGMLPPMEDLFKQAGTELPALMQGAGTKAANVKNADGFADVEETTDETPEK